MAAVTVTNGNGIIIIDDGNSLINASKDLVTVTAYYDKVRIQYGETYYSEFFYYEFISPSGNSARAVADIIAEYVFQATIIAVENYSALPPASSVAGMYYFCKYSQGTAWLPWSLGGTYYPAGTYYSDGVTWIYGTVPSEAGQANTNSGIITDRFVSPATLNNYSGWNKTKVGLSNVDNTSDADKPISTAAGIEFTNKQNQINQIKDELQSDGVIKYKEFIYTGNDISTINVWENSDQLLKLYQIDFTFVDGNLTQKEVTRISDGFTYTTVYDYDLDGNLISAETI